jgi:hypothetical protein
LVTNNHEKAAYLVDARIKGKGERKFFDIRDQADTFDNAQDLDRAVERLAAAGFEHTAEMRRLAGESA